MAPHARSTRWGLAPFPISSSRSFFSTAITSWSEPTCSAGSSRSASAETSGEKGAVKIAVYTIALNEAAHAERWANSAAEADYRIVADTGSTDDTVERL